VDQQRAVNQCLRLGQNAAAAKLQAQARRGMQNARDEFSRAIMSLRDNPRAWGGRINMELGLGEFDQAMRDGLVFEQINRSWPPQSQWGYADLFLKLGMVANHQRRFDLAIGFLNEATRLGDHPAERQLMPGLLAQAAAQMTIARAGLAAPPRPGGGP
jgi:tetratricopeptide (TPR) repeat protein